jgi:ABC-2 type transport system permease protein
VRNKSLVQKMAVPREMFPWPRCWSPLHVGPQLVILLIATTLAGWRPDPWGMFYGVMALLISMCLGTALALMFSAANVFLRDVQRGERAQQLRALRRPDDVPHTLVALRFHGHTALYLLNPIVEAVLGFQRAFWVGSTTTRPAPLSSTCHPTCSC